MATAGGDFLTQAAVYLGAAAIAVPVFQRLKLGSILGYLAAGIAVGPFGLNLLAMEEGVFHVAELGVVLFLFVIGLELSLARLWTMRGQIVGLGAAQMFLSGAAISGIFVLADVMAPTAAIVAGLSFAFSSTALALQMLKDRGEMNTDFGRRAFAILLFQDIAVIPLLAIVPFLAGADVGEGDGWMTVAKAGAVLAALVAIGKYAINPVFRMVASAGSREAFAAVALFMVAATALAVSWAGMSMALGAFLAGVLLADSKYRHQIETDIEPFRGLLLGLFFISIGMRLDLAVIVQNLALVFGAALGLIVVKAIVLFLVARIAKARPDSALKTAVLLSQGGEFAFVVISLGASSALFNSEAATLMSAIVTVSMISTPPLLVGAARFRFKTDETPIDPDEPSQSAGHVIVAGFGRMGQIIAQVLSNSGASVIAIDRNPSHIRNAERFGFRVYYGDAARLDILLTAGALDANAIVFCMDDAQAVDHGVAALRERCPTATILAVAHDRLHEISLRRMGPDFIVRETLESSLVVARNALETLGHDNFEIDDFIAQFRENDRARLLAQEDQGPDAGMDLLHAPYRRRAEKPATESKVPAGA